MAEEKCACGMPLNDKTRCACNKNKCCKCCECGKDCKNCNCKNCDCGCDNCECIKADEK